MPEVRESVGKYLLVAVTALASIVVGVSSGLLLDFFRERPATDNHFCFNFYILT
jgi:hypothetical protein